MTQRFLTVNGLRYALTIEGHGDPLVMLHGFTGSGANWSELRPLLLPHFTLVALDLPGHGNTESPQDFERYRMEHCIEDIGAILDQLAFDKTLPHLMGYSMGGRLALYTATKLPGRFRSLILESASPGLATAEERAARVTSDEALANDIERDGIEAFINRWEALPLFASQQHLDEAIRLKLREQRLKNNPVGLANSLRGMGTGVQPSLWEQLNGLNLPVLLIAGALDNKFAEIARQMHTALPHIKLNIIPEAGHTVHLERPTAQAQAVLQFVVATFV